MVAIHYAERPENVECCEIPECSVEIAVPGGMVAHCVDYCIVPELQMLWNHGVLTYCSCCGHGNSENAYIRVDAASVPQMEALGYERYEPHKCMFHTDWVSYRAKHVEEERIKGGPVRTGNIDEIRERWKKQAHYGGKDYV